MSLAPAHPSCRSDFTDTPWAISKPLIPAAKHGRRPRKADMREIVNAIFSLNRTVSQRNILPHDLPLNIGVDFYERYTSSSAAMIQMTSTGMMLRRLHLSSCAVMVKYRNVAWTLERPGETSRIDSESGRNGTHPRARLG